MSFTACQFFSSGCLLSLAVFFPPAQLSWLCLLPPKANLLCDPFQSQLTRAGLSLAKSYTCKHTSAHSSPFHFIKNTTSAALLPFSHCTFVFLYSISLNELQNFDIKSREWSSLWLFCGGMGGMRNRIQAGVSPESQGKKENKSWEHCALI